MIEIERKFLVSSETFKSEAHSKKRIVQGFLNKDPQRTVRIRIKEDQAYITIKGMSTDHGTSRFEWEKEISIQEAEALLRLCEKGVIEKTRYEIAAGKHTFEVDVFDNLNLGLIVAEIELNSLNEPFEKPIWLGEEVTGDVRYYNSQLSIHPYTLWS